MNSKAQIIATIGPSSANFSILSKMIFHNMDIARLNFSWGSFEDHTKSIEIIRQAEKEAIMRNTDTKTDTKDEDREKIERKKIPIILDLPGPRIQDIGSHTYDMGALSVLTEEDKECIRFGIEHGVDYIAQSFVGDEKDISFCRDTINKYGGHQPVIAKIERKKALENLDSIISVSDAIMVARGDLGSEVPIESIPFIQADIIRRTKKAGKPVITATQMMLSMVDHDTPTRAEVTDVANAILQGSDSVMLSEETASGKYPVEAVAMMERIIIEAEKHMSGTNGNIHLL